MELVTGPPQLHTTDVIVVSNGHRLGISSTAFNLLASNSGLLGTLRVSIIVNGRPTDLTMQITPEGHFAFPGGGLCPEPWMLMELPIVDGRNQLEYVLEGSGGGSVSADLWLWDATDQLVIFDIDGTVTKSDVRGLVANQLQEATSFLSNALTSLSSEDNAVSAALDTDYIHDGVVEAAAQIALSGYRVLYLTARPITMADKTRQFLASLGRQQHDLHMPPGPLVTQPVNTMKALAAKHDEFKSGVLLQLRGMLRPGCFAAGFGNTDTDVLAYAGAGVPHSHIFVLDKSSRLRIHSSGQEMQSYTALLPAIPALFPRLRPHAPAPPRGSLPSSQSRSALPAPSNPLPPPAPSHRISLEHSPQAADPLQRYNSVKPSSSSPGHRPAPLSWDGATVQLPSTRRDATQQQQQQQDRWSARSFMESLLPGCTGIEVQSMYGHSDGVGAAAYGNSRAEAVAEAEETLRRLEVSRAQDARLGGARGGLESRGKEAPGSSPGGAGSAVPAAQRAPLPPPEMPTKLGGGDRRQLPIHSFPPRAGVEGRGAIGVQADYTEYGRVGAPVARRAQVGAAVTTTIGAGGGGASHIGEPPRQQRPGEPRAADLFSM